MFGARHGRELTTMFGDRPRHEFDIVVRPRRTGLAWLPEPGSGLPAFADLGASLTWPPYPIYLGLA